MAVVNCKMCGSPLPMKSGATVVECEYCGREQTIPSMDNEKKLTLFARAERLRTACEFDKAAGVFEAIVADFPQEAEAYWGLVLCKYGIEYVDDPSTGEKIPTCHRSSFDSVFDDPDYEQAYDNADVSARKVYRAEGKRIEDVRRGIISVSANEDPYDVFICYKETGENGNRTLDSVLAQDIYDALTDKGYRVFFARITLEDKLGQEYEPYIFAALNSAKIMLAVGTDFEYYNAVWVKNEWSRYLKLMARDKTKHMIPCFKGLDAYHMPKEFAKLQAQDLGKVGAMQDLLRGIEKILPRQKETVKEIVKEQVVVQQTVNTNTAPILQRAFMFLEDGNWKSANEYCEKVLDIDPENAQAYVGKLMAELRVKNQEMLKNRPWPFDQNNNYKKIIRYADEKLKTAMINCVAHIKLNNATQALNSARSSEEFLAAAEQLKAIAGYMNADTLLKTAFQEAEKARLKEERNRLAEEEKARQAERIRLEKIEQLRVARERLATVRGIISAGEDYTVGLRSDGTVVAVGNNYSGKCNVSDWHDIVEIRAGPHHTVGLKRDGTVVAVGDNSLGQCNVSDWHDIVAIETNVNNTVGLKRDGTVVAVGDNSRGQYNVFTWRDIVAIKTGFDNIVGLKRDGTVVAVGRNEYGQCNVSDWRDIVAIEAGDSHIVGLKRDGTVVAVGYGWGGRCVVSDWHDIVEIRAVSNYTVGLKSDGTMVATGYTDNGDRNVSDWHDIVAIEAGSAVVGLKRDGTVVAVGNNEERQCNVSDWCDIVAISVGGWHTVGLKRDGTVVAVGYNKAGQCNVYGWKLFQLFDTLDQERKAAELQRIAAAAREKQQSAWRISGLCQHCGGSFKGLFAKKCSNCGRPKDY